MLTHLTLTNFKTWARAELAFGQITGLCGTNSSGKSSLLQFLLLLKQTREATDRATVLEFNGPYVNLGVYRDVIHNHDETHSLSWDIGFDLGKDLFVHSDKPMPVAGYRIVKVGGTVSMERIGLIPEKLQYEIGGIRAWSSQKKKGEAAYSLMTEDLDFPIAGPFFSIKNSPSPIKSYILPDNFKIYYNSNPKSERAFPNNYHDLPRLEVSYEEQFDGIFYLGPLREYPQRDYLWTRSRRNDVGVRGGNAIEAILAATAAGEKRSRTSKSKRMPFQAMVAYWLKEMGLIHDFKVVEIAPGSSRWQARVQIRKGGTEALLTDVGFGVSQVLPVITLLQYVPEGSTVILEQPEIHLHPLAQAGLADVIVETALHRNLQIVLESHSEHLLLRLQRRVAEQRMPADKLKLYFCDVVKNESRLLPLRLDPSGRIENWPRNFMGDAFGETYAAEKARLRHMDATE